MRRGKKLVVRVAQRVVALFQVQLRIVVPLSDDP